MNQTRPELDWWLACLLLAIFFTPTLRLPGNIPLRVDDVIAFGSALIACCRALYTFRIGKVKGPWLYLTLVPVSVLLCTLVATIEQRPSIGPKEYLDLLRPIKFLIIYCFLARSNPRISLRTFVIVMENSMIALCVIAMVQLVFMKPDSNGILARFFLIYTHVEDEQAHMMLSLRPFATFNTPTDLGYIATIGIFVGIALTPPARRTKIIVSSLVALLISATRTFLFCLPLLLIAYACLTAHSLGEAVKKLRVTLLFLAAGTILVLIVMPVVSSFAAGMVQHSITAALSGDIQSEESFSNRLDNLALVQYTWDHARWFGVVTRSLIGPAADSELIYTFHRYGIVGITMLLTLYPVGYIYAKKATKYCSELAQFAIIMLTITFLYGITQGAIINTRIGAIPFITLGMLVSCAPGALRDKGRGNEVHLC
jgi:hypothetical protein